MSEKLEEYRGFTIDRDAEGMIWATAGGGVVELGPFDSVAHARREVDKDLDDYHGEVAR